MSRPAWAAAIPLALLLWFLGWLLLDIGLHHHTLAQVLAVPLLIGGGWAVVVHRERGRT